MALISVDLTKISEQNENEFIDGFRSILAMDDLNNERPYCCPWTYTDSISVEQDELTDRGNFFALGRNYAFTLAPEIIRDAIVGDIWQEGFNLGLYDDNSYNDLSVDDIKRKSRFLDVKDSEKELTFTITPYCYQYIEALEPSLHIAYIGAEKNSKKMLCYDSNGQPINLDNCNPDTALLLNKLCDYASDLKKACLKNQVRNFAYDIQWDIDYEEALEHLDELTNAKAAEALDLSEERYAGMDISERHDYARDVWHHSPASLEEFMGLPEKVEIPTDLTDEEDISDWLSEEYGFCHEGFKLTSDEQKENLEEIAKSSRSR